MKKSLFFFFFLTALIITWILFKDGNLLGGGESGVAFYNITRILKVSSSPWLNGLLGGYIPQAVANIPFLTIVSYLETNGVSGVVLQEIFTFTSLFISLASFFLLTKEILPGYKDRAYILSSFFYLFNFYSIINIWNRFLLNFILFYSILPLFLWLYLKFIRSKRLIFLGIFLILSFIFSYAFSSPAHVVIFWSILFFVTLIEFVFSKSRLFIIVSFFGSFVTWVLINFWWISQQISFSFSESFESVSDTFFSSVGNSIGLTFLSDVLGRMQNLYLLKHGLYYNYADSIGFINDWPHIYGNPLAIFLEWTVLILVFYWVIKNKTRLPVVFSFGLFLIGIFLAKGNAAPFGEIFNFLFNNLSFIQFFRNPFEKLGIIAAVGFSLLIGPALIDVLSRIHLKNKILRNIIFTSPFVYIIVFLGYPFWSGLVFTGSQPPFNDPDVGYQVIVPDYYKKLDTVINSRDKDSRFITFPLGGEGIEYTWPKGYLGVEEAQILFENSSISNILSFPFYEQISSKLQKLFVTNNDFYKIASLLNARFILFRPDINFGVSGMKDPKYIDELLQAKTANQENKLAAVSNQLPLKLYEFSDDAQLPKIYTANSLINIGNNSDIGLFLKSNSEIGDVMYRSSPLIQDNLDTYTSKYILKNNAVFKLNSSFPALTDAPYIFPYVSRSASWRFYPLVLFKEEMEKRFNFDPESRLRQETVFLGKRLKEVEIASSQNDVEAAVTSLNLYQKQLQNVLAGVKSFHSIKSPNEQVWNEGNLHFIFESHLFLLNQFEKITSLNKDNVITGFKQQFLKEVSEAKILPYYQPIITSDFPLNQRVIYNFEVIFPGEYEIFIPKTTFFPEDFDIANVVTLQVDDTILTRKVIITEENVLFGEFALEAGTHEISFNIPAVTNLVDGDVDFDLYAKDSQVVKQIKTKEFDPYSDYLLSFDYLINYGEGPTLQIGLNNDKVYTKDGERIQEFHSEKNLTSEDYFFGTKNYTTIIHPDTSSDEIEFLFRLKPWNNCRKVFFANPDKCDDELVSLPYKRPSQVQITNLKLLPEYPKELFALKTTNAEEMDKPIIKYDKLSNTDYSVHITNISGPFMLTFSELFDRGWKVYEDGKSEPLGEENHVLANTYANGWLIDQNSESLNLSIKFEPHLFLEKMLKISLISVLIVIFTTGILVLKYFLSKK